MTRLITSVCAPTQEELRLRVDEAVAAGAEWIELRLDHLITGVDPAEVAQTLSRVADGAWIVTLRSTGEGGVCHAPSEARLKFLLDSTANHDGFLDFEYRACRDEPCVGTWSKAAGRHRWILSFHDHQGRPDDVAALCREIVSTGPQVIAKVAWMGRGAGDNIVAFETMRQLGERVIAVVMDETGLASRVLAKKFGAAATYCALRSGSETAPGQITLDEMLHQYRWEAIGPATRWFGVLGSPVRHSISPVLFNRLFERTGKDAVYLPMLAAGGENELVAFLKQCERHNWLDVGGFSVTLPHKQAARRFVGPRVEPLAARIGAVNTLVMRDGRFHGYNTDYAGALDALCHGLNCERADLGGLSVDVLGAGGVARAVVVGLTDCDCDVTLFNRTSSSAAALAREFGCRAAPWEQRPERHGRIVINCTSLGLTPHTEESPLPADALSDRPAVFDTVYNPAETRLLREAKQAGCVTIDGVEMFVRQAAAQYELWFAVRPDVAVMRTIVLEELGGGGDA